MSLLTEGQHGHKAHSDGPVPVQTRSERFSSTEPSAFGEVTGLELEWKFTPVARLRSLIDGDLDGAPYRAHGNGIEWADRADPRVGSAGKPEERASANAWASFERALTITLDSQEHTEVTIERSGLGSAPRAAHTVITAAPGSRGTVILRSGGPAALSENVEIVVGDAAELTVVSLQEWDEEALHLASHFATVGRDATLKHIVVSLGGAVVRLNPAVRLVGDGAHAELNGLYFADAGQHFEQRVFLHHVGPNTKGRVNYKGALQGDGARTVWVGDVLIGRAARGTDSYEQNRNLVLTEGARAISIPNLEIETGDILGAGHASATGRFDDEQLFYLQARGIPESEARRIVVLGFLTEIVQTIGSPELEAHVLAAIEAELAGSAR